MNARATSLKRKLDRRRWWVNGAYWNRNRHAWLARRRANHNDYRYRAAAYRGRDRNVVMRICPSGRPPPSPPL